MTRKGEIWKQLKEYAFWYGLPILLGLMIGAAPYIGDVLLRLVKH